MGIEKGKLSSVQAAFLIVAFMQGSILLISFSTNLNKQDTWLVVIVSFLLSIPFSILCSLLSKRFYGKNLIEIIRIVYGHKIGLIIAIFFVFDFSLDLFYNIRDIGDFYIIFLIPDTPIYFFIIVFILVCAYSLHKGIEVIGYLGHLFVLISFFIIISTFLLLLKESDFSNLMPFFDIPVIKFIQGVNINFVIGFVETVVFFNIMCCVKNTKHMVRNNLLAVFLGFVSLLIVTVRNTIVLGSTQEILTSPSFQATRLIDIGNVFSRMDILIGIGNTLLLFIKCCIIYYSLLICISELLHLKTYKPLILPVGGITFVGACTIFKSNIDHAMAGQNYVMIFRILTILILPILTLVIAKIRKLPSE